jgi:hypothetical protein
MAPCDFCPIWYICRIFFPTWIPPNATKAYVTWQNIIKYFKNPPTHWLNYTSPLLQKSTTVSLLALTASSSPEPSFCSILPSATSFTF